MPKQEDTSKTKHQTPQEGTAKTPPLKAASLKYDKSEHAAPILTAKGQGPIAEKILEIAKEHDIPLHQDADLIQILETIEIEQEIPFEIYAVVAEVFKYIYEANQRKIASTS